MGPQSITQGSSVLGAGAVGAERCGHHRLLGAPTWLRAWRTVSGPPAQGLGRRQVPRPGARGLPQFLAPEQASGSEEQSVSRPAEPSPPGLARDAVPRLGATGWPPTGHARNLLLSCFRDPLGSSWHRLACLTRFLDQLCASTCVYTAWAHGRLVLGQNLALAGCLQSRLLGPEPEVRVPDVVPSAASENQTRHTGRGTRAPRCGAYQLLGAPHAMFQLGPPGPGAHRPRVSGSAELGAVPCTKAPLGAA